MLCRLLLSTRRLWNVSVLLGRLQDCFQPGDVTNKAVESFHTRVHTRTWRAFVGSSGIYVRSAFSVPFH